MLTLTKYSWEHQWAGMRIRSWGRGMYGHVYMEVDYGNWESRDGRGGWNGPVGGLRVGWYFNIVQFILGSPDKRPEGFIGHSSMGIVEILSQVHVPTCMYHGVIPAHLYGKRGCLCRVCRVNFAKCLSLHICTYCICLQYIHSWDGMCCEPLCSQSLYRVLIYT